MFNPIAELLVPIGIPKKEAKAEIEIHPVIVEAKRIQYNLEMYKYFCAFYSQIHFSLFLQENWKFLFHLYFLI